MLFSALPKEYPVSVIVSILNNNKTNKMFYTVTNLWSMIRISVIAYTWPISASVQRIKPTHQVSKTSIDWNHILELVRPRYFQQLLVLIKWMIERSSAGVVDVLQLQPGPNWWPRCQTKAKQSKPNQTKPSRAEPAPIDKLTPYSTVRFDTIGVEPNRLAPDLES